MNKARLFIVGMLIAQAWGLQVSAAQFSESVCALLKSKGLNPSAEQCGSENNSPETTVVVKPPKPEVKPPVVVVTPPVVVKPPKPEVKPPVVVAPPVVVKPPKPEVKPPVVVAPPVVTPPIAIAKYSGPKRTLVKSNEATFADYCIAEGGSASANSPQPNYSKPDVQEAAAILSKVGDKNFYFYGDILRVYKVGSPKPAEASGYTDNAHYFLVQTCGEFRDRAEMIKGKIDWVRGMVLLNGEAQKPIDVNKNIWSQLSGHSYNDYIQISGQVFGAKASEAAAKNTLMKSSLHNDAQEPIPAYTVCETKYLVSEYVAKGRSFDSLSSYKSGLSDYEQKCSQEDKDHYFDFRGDSNFKQYSPESNAMLWHAISIARFCKSTTEANGKSAEITNEVCEAYFKNPFMSRYNAARSGLGAWLTYTQAETAGFQNQGTNVTVIPSFDVKTLGKVSFRMKLSDGSMTNPNVALDDSSLGFNEQFNLGKPNADTATAFERLRNAVNRHTNWYKSSYDDQLGHAKSIRDQAYSPFVASSYDMAASNAFTECGYTVQCDGDGRKAWMLVFRIHKDNWYNTHSLKANKPLDFDRMWIDETTFGTDSLADSEKAFDRLGTALETELDTIIYLHNLGAGSGEVVANDTLK